MEKSYLDASRADNAGSLGNKIWGVVVCLAIVLPFVALGYELARTNWISALVFASILLAWAMIMAVAWSQKPTSATDIPPAQSIQGSDSSPRRDMPIASDQQARHA